jgi:hypothetical protein
VACESSELCVVRPLKGRTVGLGIHIAEIMLLGDAVIDTSLALGGAIRYA